MNTWESLRSLFAVFVIFPLFLLLFHISSNTPKDLPEDSEIRYLGCYERKIIPDVYPFPFVPRHHFYLKRVESCKKCQKAFYNKELLDLYPVSSCIDGSPDPERERKILSISQ